MDNLLQQFLDAGLFNFGDEDARLKDFLSAADDLGKDFTKNPQLLIPAALVGLDSNVPDSDPMLELAEAAVKKHWNAFRNKFSERQKGLLRPLLLDGVSRAAASDTGLASAVWLSSASILPHLPSGREIGIVKAFLTELGETKEAEAEAVWMPEQKSELTIPKFALAVPKGGTVKFDKAALEAGLASATGPHDRGGTAYPNKPNPRFSDSGSNWCWEFTPRAAATIAAEVDKALAPLATQVSAINEHVEPGLKKFCKELGTSVSSWVGASIGALAQRQDLIWWRECVYSPKLRRSYRGLPAPDIAVGMALDLHEISVVPAPESVEFLLRETVRRVIPDDPKISLGDLFSAANQSPELAKIIPTQSESAPPRRTGISQALAVARNQSISKETLPAWLGVKSDIELAVSDLAVWIFRDAQAWSFVVPPQ